MFPCPAGAPPVPIALWQDNYCFPAQTARMPGKGQRASTGRLGPCTQRFLLS
jgi:hypothetical protein